jgi:hypothetical protein
MKSSISRSAAWLFTTRKRTPTSVRLDRRRYPTGKKISKKELRELKALYKQKGIA